MRPTPAQEALRTHEPALHRLAAALQEQEVVEREQIAAIIAAPPKAEVEASLSPPASAHAGAGGDVAQGAAVGA